jgi:hypothetical protein
MPCLDDTTTGEDFFEQFDLTLASSRVEVGKTYPIYGKITKFINDTPGAVIAEVNSALEICMAVPDKNGIEILKQRSYDWGIFITRITDCSPTVRGECETVIFGKQSVSH